MKSYLFVLFSSLSFIGYSQYYYKDIRGTMETSGLIKTYKTNKINRVSLSSFDAENKKNEDFFVDQEFTANSLKTTTRSNITSESVLTSFIDANNNVVKTIDSSDVEKSVTEYGYNNADQLTSVYIYSVDSANTSNSFEQHIWQYNNNHPVSMLRIRNKRDTSLVQFKADEKGNIIEEQEINKGIKQEPVYYYYDGDNRLTDIVTFNKRARRLLPEYMFEYDTLNRVIQQITVPSNSSDYLIWRYQYDSRGLKTREAVYNKQKQLTGKIEYQYF